MARTAVSLVLGAALLGVLHSSGHFILVPSIPWLLWILSQPLWCLLLWRRTAGDPGSSDRLRAWTPMLILCGFLLLHLFSGGVNQPWFFFLRWVPLDEHALRWGLVRLAVLTAILTPVFALVRRRGGAVPFAALLLVLQAAALHRFLTVTAGRPLFRIDHPSFLFRLYEFAEAFPQRVSYMPYWNAGTVHYAGTTSGATGPGLLLYPWLRLFPVHEVYNFGFAFLFILLTPWIGAASVRAAGGDRKAAWAGGILALGVSQHYFLWTLHYGTIGAGLSAAMVMPVCALVFRMVWLRRFGAGTALALTVSAFFLLLWPSHSLLVFGLAIAALASFRRLRRRTLVWLGACLALTLLLFSPWLHVLLTAGREAVDFVAQAPAEAAQAETSWGWTSAFASVEAGARHLLAHLKEGNPVLLFLGFAGLFADRRRGLRRVYLPVLLVLALIAGWNKQLFPKSELSRLSIAFFFAAVVPAAFYIGRFFRSRDIRLAPVQALLFALLMLGGWNVVRLYGNQGRARYAVYDSPAPEIVDWIRTNVPEDGRVLFAGRAVHAYGRGKIAYLPILTGREMMAEDYYGFPIGMIEYEYPPRPYRDGLEGLWTFFEAYNVTHVITYHRRPWLQFFRGHPDHFAEGFSIRSHGNEIAVFAVNRESCLLHGGPGRIEAGFNRLRVTFDEAPPERAVLSYNWDAGLRVAAPAEIAPHPVTSQITLVALYPNGLQEVEIQYRAPSLLRRSSNKSGD